MTTKNEERILLVGYKQLSISYIIREGWNSCRYQVGWDQVGGDPGRKWVGRDPGRRWMDGDAGWEQEAWAPGV